MTKSHKKTILRLVAGVVLFGAGLLLIRLLKIEGLWEILFFLPSYLAIGGDVLLRAVRNIFRGEIFDENFLMAIATVGAFCIGEYPEAVAVMLFYQVGELFQSYAVNRSRGSIAQLMDIRPDYANISRDGKLVKVDPDEVAVGDRIVVTPGEKIPLDGIVEEGSCTLDTSALTGESVPRGIAVGEEALSGSINLTGVLTIRATKPFGESTVSKILDLVENASSKKAKAENFITRFARYYTPLVCLAALLLAVVPPLVIPGATWRDWIYRALTFLVISCPCALVISVPLSFFGGIGGASKQGILVKGGNYLEALIDTEIAVFDKTGTLTEGVFEVTEIVPSSGLSQDELLEIAAIAESYSGHPISQSLKKAYGKEIDSSRGESFEEIAGHGIRAVVDGETVQAGNGKLMELAGVEYKTPGGPGTVVHVAKSGSYVGYIVIADRVKVDAKETVAALKQQGIRTVMLTGDSQAVGEMVAKDLGLDEVHAQLLPGDKVAEMERLMESKSEKGKLLFVGDGINDAPVLAQADIGIAMGALGSDAAIEAADIVLMDDKPSKVIDALSIARKTMRIVKQNIWFALGVKGLMLLLVALGIVDMWMGVFADVGVSVLAILNAMRALQVKDKE
ncbi:MAG: heavy metal translocating P-type ATPase [Oscillospiraceae bacterium]